MAFPCISGCILTANPATPTYEVESLIPLPRSVSAFVVSIHDKGLAIFVAS